MKLRILILTLAVLCFSSSILYASRPLPIVSNTNCSNFISRLNYDLEKSNANISLTSPKYDETLSTPQLRAYTSRTTRSVLINFYTKGSNIYRISAVFEAENKFMREEAIKILMLSCIEAGINIEELDDLFRWQSIGSDIAKNSIFSKRLRRRIDSTVIVNADLACLSIMASDY